MAEKIKVAAALGDIARARGMTEIAQEKGAPPRGAGGG